MAGPGFEEVQLWQAERLREPPGHSLKCSCGRLSAWENPRPPIQCLFWTSAGGGLSLLLCISQTPENASAAFFWRILGIRGPLPLCFCASAGASAGIRGGGLVWESGSFPICPTCNTGHRGYAANPPSTHGLRKESRITIMYMAMSRRYVPNQFLTRGVTWHPIPVSTPMLYCVSFQSPGNHRSCFLLSSVRATIILWPERVLGFRDLCDFLPCTALTGQPTALQGQTYRP